MKALKFNPKKDMKKLEKYGFVKEEWIGGFVYIKRILHPYSNYLIKEYVIDDDRYITEEIFNDKCAMEIDTTQYDLIKADLLIVESDEDENSKN